MLPILMGSQGFWDDFNRADSDVPGRGWIEQLSDWDIVSNRIRKVPSAVAGLFLRPSSESWSDGYVEAQIQSVGDNDCMIAARYTTTDEGYLLLWGTSTLLQLFKKVGTVFTELDSFTGTRSAGDILRLECVGTTIKGYLNGVERVSAVDTAFTSGVPGLRADTTGNVEFDNFATEAYS